MRVERYVQPAEFDRWKTIAEDMGFLYVASGPLVRSSYKVSSLLYLLINFELTPDAFGGWRTLYRKCTAKERIGEEG
jgi:hypothetical protein